MRGLLTLLFVLSLAGSAQAQLLEDPAGDVEVSSWGNDQSAPGNWQAVDLRALFIEEGPQELVFTVDIEGLPDCAAENCANAGDLRTYFQYGEAGYFVQQGIGPTGNAYGVLNSVEPGDLNGQTVAAGLSATVDLDASKVIVEVPRPFIVDEAGTPPIKDRGLSDIIVRSYSQFSLGGPDPTGGPSDDMLVTRDRMGFDAPASFNFTIGGGESHGLLEASSPAPFRASNGGAATYRYDIDVAWLGEGATTFDIRAVDLPSGWTFLRPNGTPTIGAGETVSFPVLIETPSGHQHGGNDVFGLRVEDQNDPDNWAIVELGVHYLTIPQPAGHHPVLYLHTLSDGAFGTVSATFGGDSGRVWMNTLEDDAGDEDVGVVAQEGFAGFTEQSAAWSVCLIPNLRLGLDMDIDQTGTLDLTLGADAVYQSVEVSGTLYHVTGVHSLDFCSPQFYQGGDMTPIAQLSGDGAQDVIAGQQQFSLTVTPEAAGDRIPYEEESQLVMELRATYTGGDPGPGGLALFDGRMELPLVEFVGDLPAGFVAGSVDAGNTTIEDFEEDDAPAKDSPAGLLAVAALLAVAWRRR